MHIESEKRSRYILDGLLWQSEVERVVFDDGKIPNSALMSYVSTQRKMAEAYAWKAAMWSNLSIYWGMFGGLIVVAICK